MTAGITHYTLQAKPCAKGMQRWEPQFCREAGTAYTKVRLYPIPPKRKQAAEASPSPVLIYAACLPVWALTLSPILTVLIYHFHMHRPYGNA